MIEHALITEQGYDGKYVALKSFIDRKVVASGDDPRLVMKQAKKTGYENPVIFFIPQQDVSLVY